LADWFLTATQRVLCVVVHDMHDDALMQSCCQCAAGRIFQGGSKVILTPAVAACQQQRHANDHWAQIKLQSCGCGRSATATQRVLCVIVHDIHDDAELCCAVQDNGNANFCCNSASSSAQRRRQDSLRSKAAQLSRRKNVHAASRVGSARTRAVEAAIDGS